MKIPREPLLAALLAAAVGLPPSAARAQAPSAAAADQNIDAPYDQRLSPEYDRPYLEWLCKTLGYRFDPATGFITVPDGRRVTRREALEPYIDDGSGKLSPEERRLIVSNGIRPKADAGGGRPSLLESDSDRPLTALDVDFYRGLIRLGLVKDGSLTADVSNQPPETIKAYADLFGCKRDGSNLRDRNEKLLTINQLHDLNARVRVEDEPVAAALFQSNGYRIREIGGWRFLYAPDDGGPLNLLTARGYLHAYGLDGQTGLGTAYKARVPELADGLRSAGAEIGPDGTVRWGGKPLTVGGFLELLRPVDFSTPAGADALVAELARANGCSPKVSGGRTFLQGPNDSSPLSRLTALTFLKNFGLSGRNRLDDPYDARPANLDKTLLENLRGRGLVTGADGRMVWQGETLTVRRAIELLSPYDKSRNILSDELLLERGWTGRRVGSREMVFTPTGPLTGLDAEYIRKTGDFSMTKLGLHRSALRTAPAGELTNYKTAQLRAVAFDGSLPLSVSEALTGKNPRGTRLREAVNAAGDQALRFWSGLPAVPEASAPAATLPQAASSKSPPQDEATRRALRAAQDGRDRLSDRLESTFADFYRGPGGAVASQMREQFRDPRTGEIRLPPLRVEFRGVREDAHFDRDSKEVVFNAATIVDEMAQAARRTLPPEQRTAEKLKELRAAFSDIEKLRAALYENPAVRAAFVQREAWNYIHEHGHALSSLKGPASIERRGAIAAPDWVDDERVAFLWETRYTHAVLTENPRAEIPPVEIQRYRRMLAGYDLWSADIVREHLALWPGSKVDLREAREIQAAWIDRLQQLASAGPVPGAARFLDRLKEGQKSVSAISDAYDRFLDENARKQFPLMRVEGNLALADRFAPGDKLADEAASLRYQADAWTSLNHELAAKSLTAQQASALTARLPPEAEVIQRGLALGDGWRSRPGMRADDVAGSLEHVAILCDALRRSEESGGNGGGPPPEELLADRKRLFKQAGMAWTASEADNARVKIAGSVR